MRTCYGKYYDMTFIAPDRDCATCNTRSTCIVNSDVNPGDGAAKLDAGKRKLSLIHPAIMSIILAQSRDEVQVIVDAIYYLSEAAHAKNGGDFITYIHQAIAEITKFVGSDIEALEQMTIAMEYGANKPEYGRNNWKKGMEWSRLVDAAQRHGLAIVKGEDIDTDSGNHHVAHMLASIHMLLGNHAMNIGTNDLY